MISPFFLSCVVVDEDGTPRRIRDVIDGHVTRLALDSSGVGLFESHYNFVALMNWNLYESLHNYYEASAVFHNYTSTVM